MTVRRWTLTAWMVPAIVAIAALTACSGSSPHLEDVDGSEPSTSIAEDRPEEAAAPDLPAEAPYVSSGSPSPCQYQDSLQAVYANYGMGVACGGGTIERYSIVKGECNFSFIPRDHEVGPGGNSIGFIEGGGDAWVTVDVWMFGGGWGAPKIAVWDVVFADLTPEYVISSLDWDTCTMLRSI